MDKFLPIGNFNNHGNGNGTHIFYKEEYESHQLTDQGGLKHYLFIYNHGLGIGTVASNKRGRRE